MTFAKNDPRINRLGRKPADPEKKLSKKQIREKELMFVLRKIKPNISKAIKTAVRIIDDEEATEAGKLKASALLIQTYKDLVKEAYSIDEEESGETIEESGAVFSLKVINNDLDKISEEIREEAIKEPFVDPK